MIQYLKNPATFLIDSGLLFEVNRRLLHPFGFALAVVFPDTDEERTEAATSTKGLFFLWDCRDDPLGITFDECMSDAAKFRATVASNAGRLALRRKALGYLVQGIDLDQIACQAYQTYVETLEWEVYWVSGDERCTHSKWEDLPPHIQAAWKEAVKVVVEP